MTAHVSVVMKRAAELDRAYRQASLELVRGARPRPTAAVTPCGWCGKKKCRKHRDLDGLLALYQRGYDL